MTKLIVAFAFLAANFYVYHFLASEAVIPPRQTFDSFPLDVAEWSCSRRQHMEPEIEANLGVTDYFLCNFSRLDSRQIASVYVGYHATQIREEGGGAGENSIHPPAHCLPGSGWDIIHDETVEIDMEGLPNRPASVRRRFAFATPTVSKCCLPCMAQVANESRWDQCPTTRNW